MSDTAKFPFDCKGCEHFYAHDMSVDDYVLVCKKHGWEVDECDAWMFFGIICKDKEE